MPDKRAEAPGAWADSNQPVPLWLTQWQVELKSSIDTPFRLEQPSMPDQLQVGIKGHCSNRSGLAIMRASEPLCIQN